MRWKLLSFLAVLLVLPAVSATLHLNALESTSYSWGDDIRISGVYTANETFVGLLRVNLVCEEESSQIFVKTIRTEDQYQFDHTTPTTGKTGECQLQIVVEGLGVSEEAQSEFFTISNTLDGTFELSQDELQLGENITLSGAIFKSSTQNTEGFAIVSIQKGNETYLLDTASFEEESLIYSFIVSSLPEGTYGINVAVTDIYGNQEDFGEVKTFKVFDSLKLTAFFDNLKPQPGQNLLLEGSARTMKDEPLDGATAIVSIDDIKRFVPILGGKFSHPIEIGQNVKSYNHTVRITIQDDFGNSAEKELEFYIEPAPTLLQTKISNTVLRPNQDLTITPQLFDQASEIMEADIKILILDVNRDPILEDTIGSDVPTILSISEFAKPGVWTLTSTGEGLTEKIEFTVESVESIDTELIGQAIHIRNIGNVRYKKDFVIELEGSGGSASVTERLDLYPNESKILRLKDYVEDGNYTLSFKDEVFESIEVLSQRSIISKSIRGITGGFITDLGTGKSIILIIVLIIIIVAIFFLLKTYKRKRSKKKGKKGFEEGQKMREKIQSKKEPPKVEKKPATTFEKKFPKPAAKKEEGPESKRYRPGEKAKSGLFNIFD